MIFSRHNLVNVLAVIFTFMTQVSIFSMSIEIPGVVEELAEKRITPSYIVVKTVFKNDLTSFCSQFS